MKVPKGDLDLLANGSGEGPSSTLQVRKLAAPLFAASWELLAVLLEADAHGEL